VERVVVVVEAKGRKASNGGEKRGKKGGVGVVGVQKGSLLLLLLVFLAVMATVKAAPTVYNPNSPPAWYNATLQPGYAYVLPDFNGTGWCYMYSFEDGTYGAYRCRHRQWEARLAPRTWG